jgi:hypothetical protein
MIIYIMYTYTYIPHTLVVDVVVRDKVVFSSKIRSIRGTYNQEISKIIKSMTTGLDIPNRSYIT